MKQEEKNLTFYSFFALEEKENYSSSSLACLILALMAKNEITPTNPSVTIPTIHNKTLIAVGSDEEDELVVTVSTLVGIGLKSTDPASLQNSGAI